MRLRATVTAIMLLAAAGPADTAEIEALVSSAMKPALDELVPMFEKRSAHTVHLRYGASGAIAQRFRNGEKADFVLIADTELDLLMREDRLIPGSTRISRTAIGIAVRKDAPQPDVNTQDAFRRVLLAARSVGYTAPAAGGAMAQHLLRVFDRLGVASQVAAKAKLADGGPAHDTASMVANGEAEIGLQHVSELMANPGVEIVGALPGDLQLFTVNRAAVTMSAREPEAAREFISFLASPDAETVYKRMGLER
jgi:molybdate transport system substrate-binding protein